jgi:hypothetical protein
MSHIQSTSQRVRNKAAIGFGVVGLAAAALSIGLTSAGASPAAPAKHDDSFSFKLVPSPGIKACLPHAGGNAKITTGKLNDTMTVSVHGMPPNSGFDLFVIQFPNKPFGLSWYQSDVQTGKNGVGSATVKGIFDSETFTVSPGGTTTVPPSAVTIPPQHQFHLGLWFNNPRTPFNLGCEVGATSPIVTPFNGEQHAGVQALNTANFPINKGPLSKVHR